MSKRKAMVVWLMNSLPPYRSSVCIRIRRELPGINLVAALSHDASEGGRWAPVPNELIPQVPFAPNQVAAFMSPGEHLRELQKGLQIVAWLCRHRPDAVVLHGYDDAARLLVAAWCVLSDSKLLISGDSNAKLDRARGVRKAIKSAYLHPLMRCADAVLPFGTLGVAYFRRYGAPRSRIFRFPAEPDYDLITRNPSAAQVESIEARRGLRPGRRRLVFSGRLLELKRVDLLINAFARIAGDRPNWDLILLGSGPERDRLQALVPSALTDRVCFIPSIQDAAEVFAVYRACDALVLPSDFDQWALVVNEAAAAGLAIVCSDVVGAAADLIREGVNGRTFRAGDVDGLTAALVDVTDATNLERYKAASRQVIADWRREADPVKGFAAAMRSLGLL